MEFRKIRRGIRGKFYIQCNFWAKSEFCYKHLKIDDKIAVMAGRILL